MKRNFDRHYFNVIDNESKAYFLGLLFADGYNWSKGMNKHIKLTLQLQDKDIIDKFQKCINGNCHISIIKKSLEKPNWSDMICLQLNSKEISNALTNLGCIQNKSKFLQFPNTDQLPSNLIPHFIRGYFDGDGSVWEGKRKIMTVKDLKCKTGKRNRIVHNVKFNITGTIDIITSIQDILIKELDFKKNKLNTSKKIGNCTQLEYSGRQQLKKFYNYLYNNATVFLNRKKEKFESIINCANI